MYNVCSFYQRVGEPESQGPRSVEPHEYLVGIGVESSDGESDSKNVLTIAYVSWRNNC